MLTLFARVRTHSYESAHNAYTCADPFLSHTFAVCCRNTLVVESAPVPLGNTPMVERGSVLLRYVIVTQNTPVVERESVLQGYVVVTRTCATCL